MPSSRHSGWPSARWRCSRCWACCSPATCRPARPRWWSRRPGSRLAGSRPAPSRRRPAHRRADLATRGRLHSASMDLHVIGPLASPAERAAVDAVLGPAESGWVGGTATRGPRAMPLRRPRDARPALAAAARRCTRSSRGSAGSASRPSTTSAGGSRSPPAEAYGVATFYALFATTPRPPVVVHVCDDIACRLAGAERIGDDGTRRGAGRRAVDDGRRGLVPRPASACATGHPRRWSPGRARRR